METHKVALGDIVLHGYADMPDPFSGLAVTAINGWRGLPGARGRNDSIPGGQGEYQSTRVLREGRSIEIRGAAIAATEFEAISLVDELEAAVAARPIEMWVFDADGAWSRIVEVQVVQIVGAWNRDRIVFAIDAYASDPRRYRPLSVLGPARLPVQVGGLVLPRAFPWDFGVSNIQMIEVENVGDVDILPRLVVEGSADAITIRGGARSLEFGGFDGTLVFDSRERRAWLNGTDVTRSVLRRDWPVVSPGAVDQFYFEAEEPSEDIHLTVEYRIGAW